MGLPLPKPFVKAFEAPTCTIHLCKQRQQTALWCHHPPGERLRGAFVTMVQAADFWKSDDPTDGLYWARFRRISVQREMKPRAVIIRKVRTQHTAQRLFIKEEDMVQAFTANRTDDAFHVSSLPRTAER